MRKFIFLFAVPVAFIVIFTVSVSRSDVSFTNGLTLLNIEQLAFGEELPEVGITCGSSTTTGACWSGSKSTTWTPFGPLCEWDCPTATGNPNDVCIDGAPCSYL